MRRQQKNQVSSQKWNQQYGISKSNTKKLERKQNSNRRPGFTHKQIHREKQHQEIYQIASHTHIPKANTQQLLRSQSSQFLTKINTIQLPKSTSRLPTLKNTNPELSALSPTNRIRSSNNDNMDRDLLTQFQQFKSAYLKVCREKKVIEHQIFLKDKKILQLQGTIGKLNGKIKVEIDAKRIKQTQIQQLHETIDQQQYRLKAYQQMLKQSQHSQQSNSTKDPKDQTDLSILSIDSQIIITNLQQTLKYNEIQINMLKRNLHCSINKYQLQCVKYRYENKQLIRQVNKMKQNVLVAPVIKDSGRNQQYMLEESIQLEISKDSDRN